jgi:acyl transferase domain-containing protein
VDSGRPEKESVGSAINRDGHGSWMTVPNPTAQREVIRTALAPAQTDPADVRCVEAHGTGTAGLILSWNA